MLQPTLLLTLLSALIILPGCKSDDPANEVETETPPTAKELQALGIEKANLLNEKHELLKELDQIIVKTKLDPDGQFKAINDSAQQAQIEFLEIRKNHPLLKKLNSELSLWRTKARNAVTSTEKNKANENLIELQGQIKKVSQTLPEMETLQATIAQKAQEVRDLRKSLAEQSPEGKKIVERIEAIDAELSSL